MNPEELQRVGRWTIRRLLGQGGFSWVFEVWDQDLQVPRALKMLRPEAARGEQFKRFWREARLLASFSDPHLVTIHESGQDPDTGCYYYVMELFSGSNLGDALADAPEGHFEWSRSVDLFLGILQGLALLHSHRPDPIVHRDIKPSNIQLTAEGVPKLFDLGIARVIREADATIGDSTALTSAHSFIGTPKYASPEQLENREVGTESDIFSLGLCLYQALAGRHLYENIEDLDTQSYQSIHRFMVIAVHRGTELPVEFPRRLDVPRAVRAVVEKALRLRPEERFRDAGEMGEALAAAREGRAPAGVRPGRRLAWAAVAGVLLLLAGGLFWLERPHVVEWARTIIGHGMVGQSLQAEVNGLLQGARDAQQRAGTGGKVDVKAFSDAMDAAGSALRAGEDANASGRLEEAKEKLEAAEQQYARVALIQQAASERQEASALGADLRKAVSAGKVAAGAEKPFRDALGGAESAWDAGSYAEAEQRYRAALRSGKEILASTGAAGPAPPADLQKAFGDLDSARNEAQKAGAEGAAASAFEHGGDLARQAGAARDQGRYAEAAELIGQAKDAYDAAAKTAKQALGDARGAMQEAETEAERVGDCAKVASPAASTCRQGQEALAAGRKALGASDAKEALRSFRDARHQFELATASLQPANVRPELSLDVRHSLNLQVGDRRTIHAKAKGPSGEPVTVTFTLTDPQGKKVAQTGTSFPFTADQGGKYELEAVARDARGAESKPERVAIRVTRPAAVPQAASANASGDAVSEMLTQYATAIETKDSLALGSVYRMTPEIEQFFNGLFNDYAKLHVTTSILNEQVHGDTGTVRFTQTVRGTKPDGSSIQIANGQMQAELVRRPGGWQMTELRRAQ
jgi:tRNA A-37 threonylcarbamoyl transferase component Bud32